MFGELSVSGRKQFRFGPSQLRLVICNICTRTFDVERASDFFSKSLNKDCFLVTR